MLSSSNPESNHPRLPLDQSHLTDDEYLLFKKLTEIKRYHEDYKVNIGVLRACSDEVFNKLLMFKNTESKNNDGCEGFVSYICYFYDHEDAVWIIERASSEMLEKSIQLSDDVFYVLFNFYEESPNNILIQKLLSKVSNKTINALLLRTFSWLYGVAQCDKRTFKMLMSTMDSTMLNLGMLLLCNASEDIEGGGRLYSR